MNDRTTALDDARRRHPSAPRDLDDAILDNRLLDGLDGLLTLDDTAGQTGRLLDDEPEGGNP